MRRCSHLMLLPVILSTSFGCAAVFRDQHPTVRVSTDPGEEVIINGRRYDSTPAEVELSRDYSMYLNVSKEGYGRRQVPVEKGVNAAWVTFDVVTCVIPVLLCIPLLVDGISGAWVNAEKSVHVELDPNAALAAPAATTSASATPAARAPELTAPAPSAPAPNAPATSGQPLEI